MFHTDFVWELVINIKLDSLGVLLAWSPRAAAPCSGDAVPTIVAIRFEMQSQQWQPQTQSLLRTYQPTHHPLVRATDADAEARRSGWEAPDAPKLFVPASSAPARIGWLQKVFGALERSQQVVARLRALRKHLQGERISAGDFAVKWWLLVTVATEDRSPRTVCCCRLQGAAHRCS